MGGHIGTDLKKIRVVVNTRNWVDSVLDRNLLENPNKCDIKPLSSLSHGVN